MIGGIDQQIQQRVDAYRDNPQQLMQRYQQNQELIDLLAMQKLKSEKDAAAREIQMQMQTTPQTIKQQREAELLGRTKDEMVKQTSGIMQERQKRQQQNMQRTANQGLPQLPAGNMQRMAGGGIVAFADGGGPLQQEDINAQLRQQIEAALELGASPEDLAERLKDNPNALAILRSMQSQQIATPSTPKESGGLSSLLGASGVIDPVQRLQDRKAALADRDQLAEKITAQREQQRQERLEPRALGGRLFEDTRLDSRSQEIDPSTIPERLPTPVTQPTTQTATQTAPSQQQMDQLQEIDTSGLAGLKKASLTPRESYEANRSVLSKELLRQQDPEKLRKERLRDFLIGAGGRSSFGSVMAGGTAASANRQAQQEAQKLQGIGSLMGVDEKLMTMDQEAQKMEIEKESNKLLSEIRQGQLTAAQMNSIAGEISSMTEQVESELMRDPTYITMNEQYQEAVEDDNTGMAEQLLRRREQYRQRKIETMYPNYADLVKTQKELNKKMLGSTGFGKVEKVPQ
jgi:predicted GIY-YIG superfamily endonuclease